MPQTPILFYDGECGLSHQALRFLLRCGAGKVFRFSPVQGQTFGSLLPAEQRALLSDTMVVQTAGGQWTQGPEAWIYVLGQLGRAGQLAARFIAAFPAILRNRVYAFVARHRYLFFGRRRSLLPDVSPSQLARFDP